MAAPRDTVWSRDAHTAAKHDLLRRYLQAWIPILLSRNQRITYAEGFAGPGVYTGGEPGSPVIALTTFAQYREQLALTGRQAQVLFVEERKDRVERLSEELAKVAETLHPLPTTLQVHPVQTGDCAAVLPALLRDAGALGWPMLVVLDSWGGPDIPFALVQQVATNRSSEVLLTFAPSFLTRHGQNPLHRESGDLCFGAQHWQGVFEQPSHSKLDFLVEAYRTTLENAGFAYTLAFEMRDEGGHELWLLFATSNTLGIEKMKEAMWRVDPVYGVRYRDPSDPDQMLLEIEVEPDTAPLGRALLQHLKEGSQSLEELKEWANLRTIYRPGQVLATLRSMMSAGLLTRSEGRLTSSSVFSRATESRTSSTHVAETLF